MAGNIGHAQDRECLIRTLHTRRDVLKLAGVAGVTLVAPPWLLACLDGPVAPRIEELDVRRTPPPVEGYANAASYRPGDTAYFHISNNSKSPDPTIGIEVLRLGAIDEPMLAWREEAYPQLVTDNASQYGCGWPATFQFVIPSTWRSGVYVMRVWSLGDPRALPGNVLFVIKPANRTSPILYQLPVTTYQAYNVWGGTSLYTRDAQGFSHSFASFERPYSTLAQFRRIQQPFIRWMEGAGFVADYSTSVDLHGDPQIRLSASGYQLLLSVGHDEYWSWEMRDNVEGFIESGGNVAFFGGNTCWWQIRFEPDTRRIVCYKDPQQNSRRDPAWAWGPGLQRRVTTNWFASPVSRPEEQMTGLSFRYGAGWWREPAPAQVPFHVGPVDHWVFAGLSQSRDFGLGTVGWETDAARLRLNQDGSLQVDAHNIPIISEDSVDGQAPYQPPDSIMVLASTDFLSWPGQRGRATMAIYRNNGVVFNAATTGWPTPVAALAEVGTITRNVIQGLSRPFPPSPPLVNLGFDKWSSSSQPDGWYGGTGAQGVQQVFQETSVDFKRAGPSSLRINAQAGYAWLSQDFAAVGASYYVVSGWIRSSAPIVDNDGHWLSINLQDVDQSLNLATARYTATDGGWQHVRAYGRAAVAGMIRARIEIESYFLGDAWFDDLRVDLL